MSENTLDGAWAKKIGKLNIIVNNDESRLVRSRIEAHPGVLKKVAQLTQRLRESDLGTELRDGDVQITLFGKSEKRRGQQKNFHFRVQIGEDTFFIKITTGLNDYNPGGTYELQDTLAAQKLFEQDSDIEVVVPLLGYDDRSGNNYFVSKWIDGLEIDFPPQMHDRIVAVTRKLEANGYLDVHSGTLFFDPQQKKIIILDLNKRHKRM